MELQLSNIIQFPINPFTTQDISAPDMLRHIADNNPAQAFVVCWPNDGSMPTYHSSTGEVPEVLMRVQEFIHKFYNGEFI
jgi:predicted xylose isomerase-like sugar epimerase